MPLAFGKIASAIGIKGGVIIALALVATFFWWRWSATSDALSDTREELTLAEAQITLLNTQAALVETAAEERQADTAAIQAAEEELTDAIAEIPDTQPDAVRVRLGCERLRQAGYLDADLPAVCGPSGGADAEAAR